MCPHPDHAFFCLTPSYKKLTAMYPSTICPECGSPNIILHADGEQECCDCGFFWTGHHLLR